MEKDFCSIGILYFIFKRDIFALSNLNFLLLLFSTLFNIEGKYCPGPGVLLKSLFGELELSKLNLLAFVSKPNFSAGRKVIISFLTLATTKSIFLLCSDFSKFLKLFNFCVSL